MVIHLKCIEMGSNVLCILNVSNTPMDCGRCLHPCTSSVAESNVVLGPNRCIKSSVLVIGISLFSYHYFPRMKYAVVIKNYMAKAPYVRD